LYPYGECNTWEPVSQVYYYLTFWVKSSKAGFKKGDEMPLLKLLEKARELVETKGLLADYLAGK